MGGKAGRTLWATLKALTPCGRVTAALPSHSGALSRPCPRLRHATHLRPGGEGSFQIRPSLTAGARSRPCSRLRHAACLRRKITDRAPVERAHLRVHLRARGRVFIPNKESGCMRLVRYGPAAGCIRMQKYGIIIIEFMFWDVKKIHAGEKLPADFWSGLIGLFEFKVVVGKCWVTLILG
jgi:hypothetical protein